MLTLCTHFRVRRHQHLFLSLCSSLLCTKFLIWCLHYPNVLSYHLVFCDWLISWSLPSFIKDVNTWFKIFSTQGHGSLEHLGFAFTLVTKVTVASWIWLSHSPFPPIFSLTPFVPPHWVFSYGKLLEALYTSVTFLCVSYHVFSFSIQLKFHVLLLQSSLFQIPRSLPHGPYFSLPQGTSLSGIGSALRLYTHRPLVHP